MLVKKHRKYMEIESVQIVNQILLILKSRKTEGKDESK